MSLWNSTLLIKDNWNAYFVIFGIIYFNITPFHCSFLFFLFNIPYLIKYLSQPLDNAKLTKLEK